MQLFNELRRRKVPRVAAIYVAGAFAVLQGADLLVEALRMPAGVLTAVAIVAIIGFPVALVLAWLFDVAPERPDSGEVVAGDVVVLPPRTIALVTILLLAGVAVGWILRPSAAGVATSGAPPSIAVLPFENAGLDPDDDFFSQGVAEELIYSLDRLPGLEVKARTSTWQFAGSSISAQQIADSIDATAVLAGRVQRSGDEVRIAVELVRGSDGGVLWQDRFEGTVDDVFETQGRIAEAIAGTLQIRLEADAFSPQADTRSAEAYDHYLRGRYHLAQRNVPAIRDGIRDFEAAIAADGEFALAWAGLGEAWMLAAVYVAPLPASEMWASSNAAIDRAIELDPTLPQPHAARGYFRYFVGRWEDAVAPLERALELDPDYTDAMQNLAQVYSRLGRVEEARGLIQRAVAREPFSRGVASAAVEVYHLIDLEEATSYCLRLLELGQTEVGLHALWNTLLFRDRFGEARTRAHEWVDALGLPPDQIEGALVGLDDTFRAIERYRTTGEPGTVHPALVHSPLATGSLHIMVGRPDLAITEAERALRDDHVHSIGVLQRYPFWMMRDDPRVQGLREEILAKFADDG